MDSYSKISKLILSTTLAVATILPFPSMLRAQEAPARRLRMMIVSPEQSGIRQTGGLAHATHDLNEALNQEGVESTILMPGYTGVKIPRLQMTGKRIQVALDFQDGVPRKRARFGMATAMVGKNPTVFLRHLPAQGENYFDLTLVKKNSYPYGPDFQAGEALGAFAKAAAEFLVTQNLDLVILNDWTMGLVAYELRQLEARGIKIPKIIFAIHNIAHQGRYNASLASFLGITSQAMTPDGMEFYGDLSMMKAGIQYSDHITTVSKEHSLEIATLRNGEGLEGLMTEKLSKNLLTGILNGIISADWNPSKKVPGLGYEFSSSNLSPKAAGKASLQMEVKFEVNANKPLFVMSSRLADQKGLDYIIPAIESTLKSNPEAQFIVIGDGDPGFQSQLEALHNKYSGQFHYEAFSNVMEKKLMRYGDFFINGPWYEPSGLNQFFAMINATIPIVSNVGGLKESIRHLVNGIKFEVPANAEGKRFDKAVSQAEAERAFAQANEVFHDKIVFDKMRQQGMKEDHSWNKRIRSKFASYLHYVLTEGYKLGPFKPKTMRVANVAETSGAAATVESAPAASGVSAGSAGGSAGLGARSSSVRRGAVGICEGAF